jgi:hypothetical protein
LTRNAQSFRQWQIPLLYLPHEAKSGLPRGCCVTRLATEFSINPGLARSTASQRRSVTAANLPSSSLLTPALLPSPSYPPYSVCIPPAIPPCAVTAQQLPAHPRKEPLGPSVRTDGSLSVNLSTHLGASPSTPSFLHLLSFGLRNSSFVGITRSQYSLLFLALALLLMLNTSPPGLPPLQSTKRG